MNNLRSLISRITIWDLLSILYPLFVIMFAFQMDNISALALLLVPGILYGIWKYPQSALVIIPVSFMLGESLHSSFNIIPREITWLSDLTIVLLFTKILVEKRIRIDRNPFKIPILLLLLIYVISAVINMVSPLVALVALRQYFKYAFLFYLILHLNFTSEDLARYIRIFFYLVLVQAPLVGIGYLSGVQGDALGGGMGAGTTGQLIIVTAAAAAYFVASYLKTGQWKYLLFSLGLMVIPVVSEVKFGYVLIPVTIMIVTIGMFKRYSGRAGFLITIFAVVFVGSVTAYNAVNRIPLQEMIDFSFIQQYSGTEYTRIRESGEEFFYMGRIARLEFAFNKLQEDWKTGLLGVGPGQTLPSFFGPSEGDLSNSWYRAASATELAGVALELGIFAVFIVCVLFYRMIVHLIRLIDESNKDAAFHMSLLAGIVGLVGSLFYNHVLFVANAPPFLFWLAAAYLVKGLNETQSSERTA